MTPTNKFVVNHRIKLSWKFFKHSLGVLFMGSPREGGHSSNLDQHKHIRRNVFMDYLDSADDN